MFPDSFQECDRPILSFALDFVGGDWWAIKSKTEGKKQSPVDIPHIW